MLHPSQSACCFVEEPCGARRPVATRWNLGWDGDFATGLDPLCPRTTWSSPWASRFSDPP